MDSSCEKKDNLTTICQEYKDEIAQAMSLDNVQLDLCASSKDGITGSTMDEQRQLNHQDYQGMQNSTHPDHTMMNDANVLHENKNLSLPNYSQSEEQNLNLESIGSTSSALSFDTHFYNSVNQSSIMVYEVPHGSLVPFDSLVSVPLGRSPEKLNEMGIMGGPSHALNKPLNSNNQLYTMNDSNKFKRHDDKLLVGQIYPEDPSNIILENPEQYDRNEKFEIGLADTISSDFNMSIENSQYTVSSEINQICLSAGYQTAQDTDSEVALTLASLGNLKPHETDGIYNTFCEVQEIDQLPPVEESSKKSPCKTSKSTLCLRSRKTKTPTELLDKESDLEPPRKKRTPKQKATKASEDSNLKNNQDKRPSEITVEETSPPRDNLLGQLLKASKHCEPASLIPSGVVGDVIPAVGYRIMDVCNLSEMIRMMHHCTGNQPCGIVIQEQASLREGAVSQLSIICTGCQEGTVCATSGKLSSTSWDINARVEQLTKEFNIVEDQLSRMLEILGIFYRPIPSQPPEPELPPQQEKQPPPPPKPPTAKEKPKKNEKAPKEKNIECATCKERFESSNHLKSHMKLHSVDLHVCPYCHAYFKKSYNLKEHVKKHENFKYECSQCHKKYSDKSSLAKHVVSIHEKKFKIECKVCSKRFYHQNHYNEHLRMHTKEKPFSCEVCGSKFSYHDSVKKHMKMHVASAKYKCRLCGKMFRWQLGLRHHLTGQHKLKKGDWESQVIITETEEQEQAKSTSTDAVYLDKLLNTSVSVLEKPPDSSEVTNPVPFKPPNLSNPREEMKNLEDCGQSSSANRPSTFLYQFELEDDDIIF